MKKVIYVIACRPGERDRSNMFCHEYTSISAAIAALKRLIQKGMIVSIYIARD